MGHLFRTKQTTIIASPQCHYHFKTNKRRTHAIFTSCIPHTICKAIKKVILLLGLVLMIPKSSRNILTIIAIQQLSQEHKKTQSTTKSTTPQSHQQHIKVDKQPTINRDFFKHQSSQMCQRWGWVVKHTSCQKLSLYIIPEKYKP